jgi:hypothetical protein
LRSKVSENRRIDLKEGKIMGGSRGEIIVGLLGQWASGKSSAAKTLVNHLGGEGKVTFITDRILLARQALNHVNETRNPNIEVSPDADGLRRFDGELASVFLGPEEDLQTVDLDNMLFDIQNDVYDKVLPGEPNWLDIVRLQLGADILENSQEGKPIVIEAGFGTNMERRGENPFSHTLSELFARLEEAGVGARLVRWIIVEAEFERRVARNNARSDRVPTVEFNRFAADGGDLDPDEEKRLVAQGTIIMRVPNNHDDIDRFRSDIIGAFDELFKLEV